MTGVVVDASALAAVLFDEPDAAEMRRALSGRALHTTTLVDYELANTALKKLRREPVRTVALLAALQAAQHLSMSRTTPDMVQVLALAAATNLTAYDASYLWVARSVGLPLVTLDRALAKAAERL